MRNIIVLLAGLMMAASANAGEGMNAEFRLRGQLLQNAGAADVGTSDQLEHRLVLGKQFKVNDKVSATATLVHNAAWGSNPNFPALTDGAARTDLDDNNGLVVNEAYMTWQVSDQFSVKAGRGTYEMSNGKVISSNDWQQVRTAFDGVAGVYESDLFRLTGFGVRFVDTDTNATAAALPGTRDDQANSVGASFDFKSLPDFMKAVNIHAMQNNTTTAFGKQRETRYGVTVAGDVAGFDYDVTYAAMTGDANATDSVEASMIDAEFGFSLPDFRNLRIFAGYHTDTGDDDPADDEENTYDGFYYDRHNNAGLMDLVTWGNLTYFKVGATLDVMENTSLLVQYHDFTATEGAVDDLGSEIDVRLTKSYDNGVTAAVRLGQFSVGDAFGGTEDITELWFQTTVKF